MGRDLWENMARVRSHFRAHHTRSILGICLVRPNLALPVTGTKSATLGIQQLGALPITRVQYILVTHAAMLYVIILWIDRTEKDTFNHNSLRMINIVSCRIIHVGR